MRKNASLLTMLVLSCALAFGQARTVTGTVRDDKGDPIPFATITEVGTKNATQADANGNFTISVKDGSRLNITSTGFSAQTVNASGNVSSIILSRSGDQLSEVVVTTALGVRKQPRELGYSVAKVNNTDLTQATPVNVQNGLTGKVSGLNIATTNNGVFGDTRITLRGIRSLTGNNQPMLVLDGSPVPLDQLNRLNPNDIEDITILKGASAAAIYGPDGVNGVIFVKTLRGSKGGAPQIKVSNSTQFESVMFMPKFQTQFGSGSGVDANGIGVFDPRENQQYGDPYDGSMREIGHPLPNGTKQMEQYSYKPDGRLNFFETGVTVQNDVSYSAKNFLLSAQDANISGTLGGDKNRRTTFRFNSGHETGRFRANFNIAYTRQNYNVAAVSPYWEVFNTAGHIDLAKYKNWRDTSSEANPSHYYNEYYQNPYFVKDRSRNVGQKNDLFAQAELGYKLASWLNLTYRASTNVRGEYNKVTTEAFTFSDYAHNVTHKYNASNDFKASVSDGTSNFNRVTSDLFLSGQKEFGDFSIDALVGQSFRQDVYKSIGISGNNLIIPTLYNVSNRTGEAIAGEANFKTRMMGVFAKATFGYKNWAFIEVTGRNDWDSRLPLNNNSFFYPGANASIVLSDAIPVLQNSSVISYLKVRGSVSKSGNVNLSGTADQIFGAYQLESIYNVAAGFPYGNLPGFQASQSEKNPDILPEFVNSKEAGIEISFLRNRINLEVTGYLQNNTNQILNIKTSRATGIVEALVNAADFDNKGIEFDLRLTPVVDLGDFRFNFRGNLSLMDSRINSVYEGLDEIGIGNANFAVVGHPAFMFKLTDYKRDPQGRVIVDRTTGYPSLDPIPKMFGNTMPKTILGINPSFAYKGFALAVTADYRGGHQVYHAIGADMDFTGSSYRSGTNGRQRFIVPNSVYEEAPGKFVENTTIVTANGGYGFYEPTNTNRGIQSNYLTSAAAWKIREIALTYEIPASVLQSTKVLKSAVIGLTGRNLFTFLPESNQWTDPEFNTSTGNAIGVNNSNILPPNRLYGFNVVLGL